MLQQINFNFKNEVKNVLGIVCNDPLSENFIDIFKYPNGVYRVPIIDINTIKDTKINKRKWENNI